MSPDRRSPTEWSKRLAETLVSAGRVPGDTAVAVLSEAASSGRPVAAVLADRGVMEPAELLAELSRISGVPSVDISASRPMGEAFRLVPELFARELTTIGYKLEYDRLMLACAEPIDPSQQREISSFLGIEVAGCVLADPIAIEHLMNAVYPRLNPAEEVAPTAASAPVEAPPMPTLEQVVASVVPAAMAVPAPEVIPAPSPVMNVPVQVYEPVMAGAQAPHDMSLNGSSEHTYDADDWQADYAVGVGRTTTLPAGSGALPDIEPFEPTLNPDGSLDIDELLTYAVHNGASDLHLANQLPPAIRIDGSLRPIEGLSRVDNEQIREMVYRILTQNLRERYEAEHELDTAHTIMGVGRFRVNLF